MLNAASRIVLGIVIVGSMVATVAVVGPHHFNESEVTLVNACSGVRTHSALDFTLFNLRAQSIGGENAICESAAQLGEDAAVHQRTARLDRRLLRKGH